MMVGLLVAGIGVLLAGLLAIGFGIPVKEFSFGNTLILVGVVAVCTGMIMLGLWAVVRELRDIARRLGPGFPAESRANRSQPAAPAATFGNQAPEGGGFLFSRDEPAPDNEAYAEAAAQSPVAPPPWHEDAAWRDRGRSEMPAPEPPEAASAPKARRNLLFSSLSRKERERAQARTADPSRSDLRSAPPGPKSPGEPPPSEAREMPPDTFDDAWPKSERSRPADSMPPRRSGRAPASLADTNGAAMESERQPPAGRAEDRPAVTVLKSGVVDGMAYSLYSDGSIEAQMPEGMMRFASIDELRSHLDQRS
jgi:hypothetical protein